MTDDLTPVAAPHLKHGLNEETTLYEGLIGITLENRCFRSEGKIWMSWLPTPSIHFAVPSIERGCLESPFVSHVDLYIPGRTEIKDCLVTANSFGGAVESLHGVINNHSMQGQAAGLKSCVFGIANFPDVRGSGLFYKDRTLRQCRLSFNAPGWHFTLDEAEAQPLLLSQLNESSGYGITHIGEITAEDDRIFTLEDCWQLIEAISYYLSFACGRWVGVVLPVGIGTDGKPVADAWANPRVDPFATRLGWTDTQNPQTYEAPFSDFIALWQDAYWREVLQIALHWYLSANGLSGGLEGAIIQTQTSFELLSSVVLVEKEQWLSRNGYEKIPAAERIRLLMHWAGIPTRIPLQCVELSKYASASNWIDSADGMTAIRNSITHPTKANREKYASHSHALRLELWKLGLLTLELCLLRILKYQGVYSNRITCTWRGSVERVPWAES
jgi:hypothetical protein